VTRDILVDLDGTLVDPAAGIIRSFQTGLSAVGAPTIDAADLGWIIGPPLRMSYPQAGVAAADVEVALTAYRVTYGAGAMFEVTPYLGIGEALAALRAAGHRLIVATSKPHVFAKPILERYGLAAHVSAIHGSELDGRRDDKGELIGHIIATERVDPARALMIGDRKFDCIGAAAHGIPTIGVLWGYGTEDELRAAGAMALATKPDDLPAIVARMA
jgi:phosphoglycolate phosphatase